MRRAKILLYLGPTLGTVLSVLLCLQFFTFPVNSLALTGASPTIQLSGAEQTWIQEHPIIRVAPDPDFPPLEFIDRQGQYRGIAADFIRLLETKLPLKFEIVKLDSWDEVLRQIKAKQVDMLGAAVPTPERLQYLSFTRPFVEFPAVVLVRDSVDTFPKLKDLRGKHVAVVSNYADHEYMRRTYPEIPLEVMPDISSGLRQVSFGKVDAMVLNLASASYFIKKDGISNLKVSEDTNFVFDLSFAVRDDWPELTSLLEKGLAAVTPAEREAVLENWISLSQQGWQPSPIFLTSLMASGLLLGLLVVISWNRSLKLQVQERTKDLQNELEERLQAQQEKQKLQKQMERSKKMEALGLLAGGVAHDLNNILSGVTGYAELLLHKLPQDSPFRKHAGVIRDSGQRAAAVVADMLTISRDAASDKRTLDLNRLLQEYLHSAEHQALQDRFPQVEFISLLSPRLFRVSCSETHIKKAIMNLVINAAEATEEGTVGISTENSYVDRPFGRYESVAIGEYVRLKVTDSGPGIAAEDLEHIFEPFFSRKKMGTSGTGLGLTVVWNTVQEHGGYIDIEQPGTGSSFNIYLPISREEIAESDQDVEAENLRGNGERILIIDDEEHIRNLAAEMLENLGYQVFKVSSGEAALVFLAKQQVDLLLLDMIMEPGLNGCETYQRALAVHPGQKALLCSGFSESAEVRQAQEIGAGQYLKKPYTFSELGRAVRKELKSRG